MLSQSFDNTWHYVTAWQGKDMPDLSSITKGAKIYVVGRLRMQRYNDSEGVERVSYEVLARKVGLIETDEPFQYEM